MVHLKSMKNLLELKRFHWLNKREFCCEALDKGLYGLDQGSNIDNENSHTENGASPYKPRQISYGIHVSVI